MGRFIDILKQENRILRKLCSQAETVSELSEFSADRLERYSAYRETEVAKIKNLRADKFAGNNYPPEDAKIVENWIEENKKLADSIAEYDGKLKIRVKRQFSAQVLEISRSKEKTKHIRKQTENINRSSILDTKVL